MVHSLVAAVAESSLVRLDATNGMMKNYWRRPRQCMRLSDHLLVRCYLHFLCLPKSKRRDWQLWQKIEVELDHCALKKLLKLLVYQSYFEGADQSVLTVSCRSPECHSLMKTMNLRLKTLQRQQQQEEGVDSGSSYVFLRGRSLAPD